MRSFSKKEAFIAGWNAFKERPFFLIGLFVITAAVSFLAGLIADEVENGLVVTVINIADFAIQTIIGMGLTLVVLRVYDGVETDYTDLLEPLHLFWKYLIASILVMIVVLFGLVLFIIHGIVAGVALMFVTYLIVDRNLGPVEAMKESLRITNGHRWNIILFLLMAAFINVLGVLLLGIGLLVTIPVTTLATVHVYRWLQNPPVQEGIEVSTLTKIVTGFAIGFIIVGFVILFVGIMSGFFNDSALRDTQRRGDLVQIKLASEMYFDANKTYPASIDALVPTFLSGLPVDPITGEQYEYVLYDGGEDFEVCANLEDDTFGGLYCEFGLDLEESADAEFDTL